MQTNQTAAKKSYNHLAQKKLDFLELPAQQLLDEITQLANISCNTTIAFISLFDSDKHWFRTTIGLENVVESPMDVTFCALTLGGTQVFEISDATSDARFKDNPLVTNYPNIKFYAGVPLFLADKETVGTLSVLSSTSQELTDTQKNTLLELSRYLSSILTRRKEILLKKANNSKNIISVAASSCEIKVTNKLANHNINELRISQLNKIYQMLSVVSQAKANISNRDELFTLVCKYLVELGGLDLAFIVQVDDGFKNFLKVACAGEEQGYIFDLNVSPLSDIPAGQGTVGIAFRENKSVIVQNFQSNYSNRHWVNHIKNSRWCSCGSFPIQQDGKCFAVLTVYSKQSNFFFEEIVSLINALTIDISVALDKLKTAFKRDAEEESLVLAASLFDITSEGVMITNVDNAIVAVNPAFTEITGYLVHEVLGKSSSLLNSENHEDARSKEKLMSVTQTGAWEGEIWEKRKSGEYYPQLQKVKSLFNSDGSLLRRITIFSDNSEKRASELKIWKQANFDFLTELPNRRLFYEKLEKELNKSNISNQIFALLIIDIDHFKDINDSFGHDVGDILLKEIASRLKSAVAIEDTVARLGGDEFTIIITNCLDYQKIKSLVSKILLSLSNAYLLSSDAVHSSASIGVAVSPDHGKSVETLLKNADQALFVAKKNGRNCYSFFTDNMQVEMDRKSLIARDLKHSIQREELCLVYQPIIELQTKSIRKAEVLLRWNHPILGFISPTEFIPIAEETGMIDEIGDWVIDHSLHQLNSWNCQFENRIKLCINISSIQLKKAEQFFKTLNDLLRSHAVDGKNLIIEIHEVSVHDSDSFLENALKDSQKAGIGLSIDDFGVRLSPFSYAKKIDFNYIKIDKGFIENITSNKKDVALCSAIVEMAHKLDIKTIAMGIYSQAQIDVLVKIGCDLGQGEYLSQPLSSDEIKLLFLKHEKM